MIAITVGAPPVSCKVHRALAPRRNMLKLAYHEYRPQFFHILSRLDAQAEWVTLHKIAEGHEPVLLCFEHPPFSLNNWCHRRMVAEWFEKELGHQVEELGHGMIPIRLMFVAIDTDPNAINAVYCAQSDTVSPQSKPAPVASTQAAELKPS